VTGQSSSGGPRDLKSRKVRDAGGWSITDGLGILPSTNGLSYGENTPPAEEKVDEASERRDLVTAALGQLDTAEQPALGPIGRYDTNLNLKESRNGQHHWRGSDLRKWLRDTPVDVAFCDRIIPESS
jgi:hypothetical protein